MRAAIIALCLALAVSTAAAQQPQRQLCAPREAILEKWAQEFGEVPTAGGVDGGGQLVEILTSPSGTWTLLIVLPSRVACVFGSGDGWREYPPTAPGRDS